MDNNLEIISAKIAAAAEKSPNKGITDIQVVAASKNRDIATLKKLFATSRISALGENKVQEFVAKYDPDVVWDFIGQLQTNKVKYIIGKVRLIHSVDREGLAAEINRLAAKAGIVQDILVQINSGGEQSKGGVLAEDAEALADVIQNYANIRLRGIMAVAPIDASPQKLTELFTNVYEVYQKIKSKYPTIDTLSMGMSNDYKIAIECGATLVRLGRVLFDT